MREPENLAHRHRFSDQTRRDRRIAAGVWTVLAVWWLALVACAFLLLRGHYGA